MLSSLRIELEGEIEKSRNDLLGSLFQGFIMKNIYKGYADILHMSTLHPYSQYVTRVDNKIIWTLNTLNIEAKENIADKIKQIEKVNIKYREKEYKITSIKEENISYKDLVKENYLREGKRILKIKFLTPTSFKQDGRYVLFPSIRLIFQSLMMKFDKASTDMEVFSKDILETFENNIEICGYKLRSTAFHLDGTKVPAFIGEITVNIKGPKQLVNFANMLIAFGTYSGVGIKTGIGMGGIAFE
jgi:CRISPR-associated endoribonuclease cas6